MTCVRCGNEVLRTGTDGLCVQCLGMRDEGSREEQSPGGALREAQAGKGRFDLLPCVVWDALAEYRSADWSLMTRLWDAFGQHDKMELMALLHELLLGYDALRRLAVWYELGGLKYGDRNWEKGLQKWQVESSALRHAAKLLYEMQDEDHASALAWNIAAWLYFNEVGWPK